MRKTLEEATQNHTRITVDLGNPDLYRALKFAAVAQGVPVRKIIVEALVSWLEEHRGLVTVGVHPPSVNRS